MCAHNPVLQDMPKAVENDSRGKLGMKHIGNRKSHWKSANQKDYLFTLNFLKICDLILSSCRM